MSEELERQKLFSASTARISKVWPDHAQFRLDNPQNKTDERAQEILQATQEALNTCWLDCKAGKATISHFKVALADWELRRFWAAEHYSKEQKK